VNFVDERLKTVLDFCDVDCDVTHPWIPILMGYYALLPSERRCAETLDSREFQRNRNQSSSVSDLDTVEGGGSIPSAPII
jgi:hypothetical protein